MFLRTEDANPEQMAREVRRVAWTIKTQVDSHLKSAPHRRRRDEVQRRCGGMEDALVYGGRASLILAGSAWERTVGVEA